MRILLVEDEKKIARFAKKGLEEQGFNVDLAMNGDLALEKALTENYDAVVLDIMLPGRDGLSILRKLRDRHMTLPVILLTARSDLNERVEGLNLGADDYLTKPFYVEELVARLHAVMRRSADEPRSVIEHGGLRLDLLSREASRDGAAVDLTAREFNLLEYLLRSPGRVFSRTQIYEHVWNYHFDPETNLVDVYIQKLRRKIDDDFEPKLIETVRGVGYRVRALG